MSRRRRVWRRHSDRGESGPGPAGTESFGAGASIPPVAPALPARPALVVGDVSVQQLIRFRPWDKAAPFCRHGMEHGFPCHVHVKGSGFAWAFVNDGDLVMVDGAGAPHVMQEIRTLTMNLSDGQRRCERCGSVYEWRRSSSRSLKLTFCTFSCERAANGMLIEDILVTFRRPVVPRP